MADISKIKVPGGSEYDIKDSIARNACTNLNNRVTNVEADASTAYNLSSSALSKAESAINLANQAVPTASYITTAQINQIWEDN